MQDIEKRQMVQTDIGPVCLSDAEFAEYALKSALSKTPAPFSGVIFDISATCLHYS